MKKFRLSWLSSWMNYTLPLVLSSGVILSANASVTYYTSDHSNSTLSSVALNQYTLGNSTLLNPSQLANGIHDYKYSAVVFTPYEDGVYTFGQSFAVTDTVMILYDGIFQDTAPGENALVGNDDTDASIHRENLGDPTKVIECARITSYCPAITFSVQAGKTYTLWVSNYRSDYNDNFDLPFEFYSTGRVIFGQHTGRTPIDLRSDFYHSSEIGLSVDPIFVGGTLKIDEHDTNYEHDFTLSDMATNTIDHHGKTVKFSGSFSDHLCEGNDCQRANAGGNIIIANSGEGGLTIFDADNTYTGSTVLKDNGTLLISKDSNLGHESATLIFDGGTLVAAQNITSQRAVDVKDGKLHIQQNATVTLSGALGGQGTLRKDGAGKLVLSGNNALNGTLHLAQGAVQAGKANSLGAETTSYHTDFATVLDLNGYHHTLSSLEHAGLLQLSAGQQTGTTLTLAGDYVGKNGIVNLNTNLATLESDHIAIHGNSTGHSWLNINKISDGSALTQGHGIEIVHAQLPASRAETSHTASFSLSDPLTAGMFEYQLYKNANNSWYLRNNVNGKMMINPAGGAFLANQYAANNLFDMNWHDRRVATSTDSGAWIRTKYDHLTMDLAHDSQDVKINSTLVQLGGDIYSNGDISAGLFGGFGRSTTESKSKLTANQIGGSVKGYHVGMYGNWTSSDDVFIDVWTHFAWFNNKTAGQKYDSNAWTTAVEAGYRVPLFYSANSDWFIEPHAQAYFTVASSDDLTDAAGTQFTDAKGNGFKSRLGARFYGLSQQSPGFLPFVEANWLYNDTRNSVKLDGMRLDATQPAHLGEAKIGIEGRLTEKLSSWLQVSGRWGENDFKRYEAQIGVRYDW